MKQPVEVSLHLSLAALVLAYGHMNNYDGSDGGSSWWAWAPRLLLNKTDLAIAAARPTYHQQRLTVSTFLVSEDQPATLQGVAITFNFRKGKKF